MVRFQFQFQVLQQFLHRFLHWAQLLAGPVLVTTLAIASASPAAAELIAGPDSPQDAKVTGDPSGPFDPRAARCGPLSLELWEHPVGAEIVDGFRPPSNPYGPGNRGLEYGTESGDVVTAASPGTVAFAGQVGGRLFVVVLHPSGLRTTYSYLDRIDIAVGAIVETGQPLALAGPGMHLTVRDAGTYIDPLPFMADYRCFIVRLVPLPDPG